MSAPARAPGARRTPLERAALAAVLLFLGLFALRQVASPDAGWHLRTGADILASRAWPELDLYTYTVGERLNLATSWAYDVGVALVHSGLGVAGLTLVHAALVVLVFGLALRTAGLARSDAGALALLLLLGGVACEERFEVRPELVSYAFLAAALHLLQRRSEGRSTRTWLLVPLFWAWSNAHSLHVVGWVALGCFVAGTWLRDRRPDLPLVLWSAAAVAVSLVNPYGWRGVAQNLSLATRLESGQLFAETIAEYASPFATLADVERLHLHLVPIACLLLYAVVVLVSLPGLWRQRRFGCVLLALVGLALALSMERNAPILVLATLPGTAWGLPLERLRARVTSSELRRRLGLAARVAALALAVVGALRVTTSAYYADRGRLERFGLGWNRNLLPVDVAAWAREAGLEGRVLNHLNLGGHLMWELRGPVFADGRLEVMGEEHYAYAQRTFASLDGLEEAAERHGVTWVVFPYQVVPDLMGPLHADPRWRLAYLDPFVAAFLRTGANEDVESTERALAVGVPLGPFDLSDVPGLGEVPRDDPLERWLRGLFLRQDYPVEGYALGVAYYLLGDVERLAWYSAEGLRQSGGAHQELWGNLGSALLSLGRREEARACFLNAMEMLPLYRSERRAGYAALAADIERALRTGGR